MKRWNEFWYGLGPNETWSRRYKTIILAIVAILIVALVLSIVFSATVFRQERVIEKIIINPTPAPVTVIATVEKPVQVEVTKTIETIKEVEVEVPADRIKAIPKTWSSFTGQQAMDLALSSFGNIRIKVLFSSGSVPLISEVKSMLLEKQKNVVLSSWIGTQKETMSWPIGFCAPNLSSAWATEIFLAKDEYGIVRYYYIDQISYAVSPVSTIWVSNNNIWWVSVFIPTYQK
jgi:hypothetical protein